MEIKITGIDEFRRKHAEFTDRFREELRDGVATAASSIAAQMAGALDRQIMMGIDDRAAIEGEYEVVEHKPLLGDGNE